MEDTIVQELVITDVMPKCRRCGSIRNVDQSIHLCDRCKPQPIQNVEQEIEPVFDYINHRSGGWWERCGGGWRRKPSARMS